MNSVTVGLDTAKSIFHAVEKNQHGRVLKKAKLTRKKLIEYFSKKNHPRSLLKHVGHAIIGIESLLN